ncbi:excalibur calcium-binding domain-containing protein [Sphingomonas sp. CCH18-H6]|nr:MULTISPECIES: excalibur calcium-binding domain-containing protein [unclassified Sphingomonas]
MTFRLAVVVPAVLCISLGQDPVRAHGGGLNKDGCHHDRKGGTGYHCHRGSSSRSGQAAPLQRDFVRTGPNDVRAFANCAAARAAGAAPVRAGDAGYGRHLDRDGDGVGCE